MNCSKDMHQWGRPCFAQAPAQQPFHLYLNEHETYHQHNSNFDKRSEWNVTAGFDFQKSSEDVAVGISKPAFLRLPELVDVLAKEGQVLRWDESCSWYEVLDGPLFEDRFNSLRCTRGKRKEQAIDRPFARFVFPLKYCSLIITRPGAGCTIISCLSVAEDGQGQALHSGRLGRVKCALRTVHRPRAVTQQ